MSVRLALFGSPIARYGGGSVALPFERRSQLLVFLALKRAWVGRAELASLLWPDQENKLAFTNLRKALFRLQSLPWAPSIQLQGGAIRADIETDVFAFDAAVREERIADALALRGGQLLAGFDDGSNEAWSSWLQFERDRLRSAWRGAALSRLSSGVAPDEGLELSARLLEDDPLDEAALRAHMACLAQSGQTARARQAYREFVDRLQKDLGLAPGNELKALHDALGTTASVAAAPLPATARAPDDGFVGRSTELRRIAALLAQDDCRVLCLIGPGGIGKTRLAQRALQQLGSGYPDGAAFIALEDVLSPDELGGCLARELGVGPTGRLEPIDHVIETLRERQMLLVLDNFEQIVAGGAALLDRLLQACPRVKIIVTSRVRLGASAWLLPLEGLPCPEPEDQDRVDAFDAARLFIQAARRVQPAFDPGAEAAAIADICRSVDGMPLALELAAAWTRVLPCVSIAAELTHGGEILQAVDDARPARHASIDVVFDQSWQMLQAIERDALSRLSVFRGGFSAEAARAIAGASLPVLGALADKSLLRKDGARLSLHPLLHQLAAARLGEGVARTATEEAHAAYFHRMLFQLRRAVAAGDREALQQMDTEFENCRTAWRWSAEHGASGALMKSALTLLQFCDHRGRFEEGLALLGAAADSPAAQADTKLEALLLAAMAHLEYRMDRYVDAMAVAGRALEASRTTRDRDARLQCLKVMGACSLRLGRLDDARRYFSQALRQSPAGADPHNAAAMLDNLALVESASGRYAEAASLSMQSLLQHRRLGDVAGEALCLNNLGMLQLNKGDFESAGHHLRAGLTVCERHGLVSTRGLILANLTELSLKTGALGAAERHAAQALEIARATANRAVEAWLRLQLVSLAVRRGDLPAARSELAAALDIALTIARPSLKIAGLHMFAEVLEAQGEAACARLVLEFVSGHPSTGAPERDETRARLQALSGESGPPLRWPTPDLDLDHLAHRIVVEGDVAHAPLIAALRAAR